MILRAQTEADKKIMDAEILGDVETWVRGDESPWRPQVRDFAESRAAHLENEKVSAFTVAMPDDEPAGMASLWGIDFYNRKAHIGLSLRPTHRGKGLGTDVVRVLCRYAFVVLGLHRVGIETLADNEAMIRSAQRVGFVREGVLRRDGWVMGKFLDIHMFGLLVEEWTERHGGS